MLLCVVDNSHMSVANRVNSVNLSTNLKNPAASKDKDARVSDPVPDKHSQGP